MTAKRQEATKLIYNHDEAITNLNSYYLLNTVYSSLEEVFEFCWGSFANEHNTLLKLTRRNVKLKKFAFATPWLPDLLCKYWFTSSVWNFYRWVAAVLLTKRPKLQGARRNSCFCRLGLWFGVKFWDFGGWGWWNVPFTTITVTTTRIFTGDINLCSFKFFVIFSSGSICHRYWLNPGLILGTQCPSSKI